MAKKGKNLWLTLAQVAVAAVQVAAAIGRVPPRVAEVVTSLGALLLAAPPAVDPPEPEPEPDAQSRLSGL